MNYHQSRQGDSVIRAEYSLLTPCVLASFGTNVASDTPIFADLTDCTKHESQLNLIQKHEESRISEYEIVKSLGVLSTVDQHRSEVEIT
mgnify:CR=1 FL=1